MRRRNLSLSLKRLPRSRSSSRSNSEAELPKVGGGTGRVEGNDGTTPSYSASHALLTQLPVGLSWGLLTHLYLDGNRLQHSHLEQLLEEAISLKALDVRHNCIVRLPHRLLDAKKLRKLLVAGNPLAYPPAHICNSDKLAFIRAFMIDNPSYVVHRMYYCATSDQQQKQEHGEAEEGQVEEKDGVHGKSGRYIDFNVCCIRDPLVIKNIETKEVKDEDRECNLYLPADAEQVSEQFMRNIPTSDYGKKNRYGDPDRTRGAWDHLPNESGHNVFPARSLYFGVFDGHGGSAFVSTALKQHLHKRLCAAGLFDEDLEEAEIEEKACNTFVTLDEDLAQKLGTMEKSVVKRAGSTAVSVLLNRKRLCVFHVGDSRCVLGRCDGEFRQTQDHDPDVPAEIERVLGYGGSCEQMENGVWRVNGHLAMTRAFGDVHLKGKAIDAVPDVWVQPALGEEHDWMIVASDGLWHHLSSKKALKIVRKCTTAQQAAHALYSEMMKRIHSNKDPVFGRDNTTITVVRIDAGQCENAKPLETPI